MTYAYPLFIDARNVYTPCDETTLSKQKQDSYTIKAICIRSRVAYNVTYADFPVAIIFFS